MKDFPVTFGQLRVAVVPGLSAQPCDGSLRFRDAATLLDEPWTPAGNFADFRPPWTGDWNDDGHDELA